MIPDNSNIYLETSGLNYLTNNYSWKDGKATRIFHALKGTKFYISPITIWEILLTSDESKKEKIIFYAQNLCYSKLINSPSEFIINYILSGCPIRENKYDFHTKLDLGKTWLDLSENTAKTFVFDKDLLNEKTKLIRTTFKNINKYIEDLGIINPNDIESRKFQLWLNDLIRADKDYEFLPDRERQRRKLALLLIFFLLCAEADFDKTPITSFWNKLGISSTNDRMLYVINNLYNLVHTGPFALMSEMGMLQLEEGGKSNRGIYLDILHSIYLTYTNMFWTNDSHFKRMQESDKHVIYNRIVYLQEIDIFTARKIEISDEKIIK
ncbi:MAG: hypothetical protein Q8861_07710 [Bacteroidota bacterium]|nr:hypothetical protein [Bacteroidota bacterium]